jgi:hypothetical protein
VHPPNHSSAHEVFVLNGAVPNATYTVTRRFFFQNPECAGDVVFAGDMAELQRASPEYTR